jgi:hypothetical protein
MEYFLNESIRYAPETTNDTSSHVFKDLNDCFTAHYEGKIIVGEIADRQDIEDYHELFKELKKRAKNEFWAKKNKD